MTGLLLALSLSNSFTKLGAIAAFVALVGIAILSLLVFSQAREIKRLREWAGRAPERAAEREQRVSADAAARVQRAPAPPDRQPSGSPVGQQVRVVPRKTPLVSAPVANAVTASAAAVGSAPAEQQPPATPAEQQPPATFAPTPAAAGARPLTPSTATGAAQPEIAKPPVPATAASGLVPASPAVPGTEAADRAKSEQPEAPARQPAAPATAAAESVPQAAAPAPATAAAQSAGKPPARSPLPPSPEQPKPPAPRAAAAARPTASRAAGARPRAAAAPATAAASGVAGAGRKDFRQQRSSRRTAVLAAAALVVVVLVLVFAVSALKGGSGKPIASQGAPQTQSTGSTVAHGAHHTAVAASPGSTSVIVLNGTATTGLAHHLAADLQQSGYSRAEASAAVPPGTHQTTVVEYSSGHRADAQGVARALDVTQVQPMEATIAGLAGAATVVVLAGADQAAQLGGGGAQSQGEPAA